MTRRKNKYHVNSNGRAAICTATMKRCPFAESLHFDTIDEAKAAATRIYSAQHGLLPNVQGMENLNQSLENPDSMTYQIMDRIKSNAAGLKYEIYCTSALAENQQLDSALFSTEDGYVSIGKESSLSKEEMDKILLRAQDVLQQSYEESGSLIKDKEALTRVVYFSKDSDQLIVQSGGSNVLDAAIIDSDDNVSIYEIKNINAQGSQLSAYSLDSDYMGSIKPESLNRLEPEVADELSKMKVSDSYGTNAVVKVNELSAMEHFVNSYKNKGATGLIYTNEKDLPVIETFADDTETIAKRMIDKGMKAELRIRSNTSPVKLTDTAKDRWNFAMGSFFENKFGPSGDTFKFKELDKSMMTSSKNNIKVGEFILPLSHKDINNIDPETEINIDDLKFSPLKLMGDLKPKKIK